MKAEKKNSHGGARDGAGRKPVGNTVIALTMGHGALLDLDKWIAADAKGVTEREKGRPEAIRYLIACGIKSQGEALAAMQRRSLLLGLSDGATSTLAALRACNGVKTGGGFALVYLPELGASYFGHSNLVAELSELESKGLFMRRGPDAGLVKLDC